MEESKIDITETEKLYELVGRNIADLKSVADKILDEQSFERLKKDVRYYVRLKLPRKL